jgi:hypothetical protein
MQACISHKLLFMKSLFGILFGILFCVFTSGAQIVITSGNETLHIDVTGVTNLTM